MQDEIKVLVSQKGDAIVHHSGYMVHRGETVVAFYLDARGNTGRAYPAGSMTNVKTIEGEYKDFPALFLVDEDEKSETLIYFPEFPGWHVHCADGGKTMSICLVKG